MKVKVRLFAGLRERAGYAERELSGVERVADIWPALGIGDEPDGLLYAVNRTYADGESKLADGDEVALIPPVSGGSFRVAKEPLSLDAVVEEVSDESAGAVASFLGTVRRESRGRKVLYLEYEAYAEMAEDVMAQIAADLEQRYDLRRLRCTTESAESRSAKRASRSRCLLRTARTPSPPVRKRSTRSSKRCRSGKRRSTRAERSGSDGGRSNGWAAAAGERRLAHERSLLVASRSGTRRSE